MPSGDRQQTRLSRQLFVALNSACVEKCALPPPMRVPATQQRLSWKATQDRRDKPWKDLFGTFVCMGSTCALSLRRTTETPVSSQWRQMWEVARPLLHKELRSRACDVSVKFLRLSDVPLLMLRSDMSDGVTESSTSTASQGAQVSAVTSWSSAIGQELVPLRCVRLRSIGVRDSVSCFLEVPFVVSIGGVLVDHRHNAIEIIDYFLSRGERFQELICIRQFFSPEGGQDSSKAEVPRSQGPHPPTPPQ